MSKNTFIKGWRACSFSEPPYVFPGDKELLDKHPNRVSKHLSFEDFVESDDFGPGAEKKLHLGLLPAPYSGNLDKASIFVLLLNPGFSPVDYYAEHKSKEFRDALLRNLRQENANDEYPFRSLDPQFSWRNKYWTQKFQGILGKLSQQMSYRDALKLLAHNVACIQFIPYHSKSFDLPSSVQKNLASSKAAVDYVKQVLEPRAAKKDALIIVARKGKKWGLTQSDNIIVYEGSETLSAHLTPGSRGGDAIIKHLERLKLK